MGVLAVRGGKPINAVVKSMVSKAVWFRMDEATGVTVLDKSNAALSEDIGGTTTGLHSTEGWLSGTDAGGTATNYIHFLGNQYIDDLMKISTLGSGLLLFSYEVFVVVSGLSEPTAPTTGMFSWGTAQLESGAANGSIITLQIHTVGTGLKCGRTRIATKLLWINYPTANGTPLPTGRNSLVGMIDGLNGTLRYALNGVEVTPLSCTAEIAAFDDSFAQSGGLIVWANKVKPSTAITSCMSDNFKMRNLFIGRFETHPGEAFIADYIASHNTYQGKTPEILTGL